VEMLAFGNKSQPHEAACQQFILCYSSGSVSPSENPFVNTLRKRQLPEQKSQDANTGANNR